MTVAEAIAKMQHVGRPDTSLVRGLSLQCISQLTLDSAGILVPVQGTLVKPATPNVHLYFQQRAAESLADVAAGWGVPLVVISGYRTPIQQLVLYELWQAGAGVPLAAKPGKSNHERGAAVDVRNEDGWKPFFVRRGWRWLGAKDPAHFDLSGQGIRTDLATRGVMALQRLLNHHGAGLEVDGAMGARTIAATLAAPAGGYGG